MAYTKSDKSDSPMRRRGMGRRRKKVCVFCGKENLFISCLYLCQFLFDF